MGATGEIRQKVDVEFRKEDWARFFSHHDLLRYFERALRRSGLPVRMTHGFNPKPRMVFPTPLALGIQSSCEHLELEFIEPIVPRQVVAALAPLMLPGIVLVDASALPKRRQGRKPRRITYRLSGFPAKKASEALDRAVAEVEAAEAIPVTRQGGRRGSRSLEVRSSLRSIRVDEAGGVEVVVDATARHSIRPQEVAALLAEATGLDGLTVEISKTACELSAS